MEAEAIARALAGTKIGNIWMARCPSHDDRTPSLAIREGHDGKVLVRCHAGCSQWDVIRALTDRGIWRPRGQRDVPRVALKPIESGSSGGDEARTAFAMLLWQEARVADRTPVATYLRARGLTLPPPPSLRFHPHLKHSSGSVWPGMVALVVDAMTTRPSGVHRTFLSRDGAGKAPVTPDRMMLGRCRGGVVQLADATDMVMVGEGIETCLAAMRATGRPAWAALSTSGLRSLSLPRAIASVTILADADEPGEAAAKVAQHRWLGEGRTVRIARPTGGRKDFNDLLLEGIADRRQS